MRLNSIEKNVQSKKKRIKCPRRSLQFRGRLETEKLTAECLANECKREKCEDISDFLV